MTTINKSKFMKSRVKEVFGDIEVYNMTEYLKGKIYKEVIKINQKVVQNIAKDLEKNNVDLTNKVDSKEFKIASQKAIKQNSKQLDKLFMDYLAKLTNIPEEIIADKDVMNLPSEDMENAISVVSKMISEIVESYNKVMSAEIEKMV